MGRFITEDPIKDGNNWYVYCANNPLKYIDPTGLEYHGISMPAGAMRDGGYDKNGNYTGGNGNGSGSKKIYFLESADPKPPLAGNDPLATNPDYDPNGPFRGDGDSKYITPPTATPNDPDGSGRGNGRKGNLYTGHIPQEAINELEKIEFMNSDIWGSIVWKNETGRDEDLRLAKEMAYKALKMKGFIGEAWNEVMNSKYTTYINVNSREKNNATPKNMILSGIGIGSDIFVNFDPINNKIGPYRDGSPRNPEAVLTHEVIGHAYYGLKGQNNWTRAGRERKATAIDNAYRAIIGFPQRKIYGPGTLNVKVPQYTVGSGFTLDGKKWNLPGIKE